MNTTVLKFDLNYHFNMVAPIFFSSPTIRFLTSVKAGGVPMAIQHSRKKSASNLCSISSRQMRRIQKNSIMMMWMHALLAQPAVPRMFPVISRQNSDFPAILFEIKFKIAQYA
jgi:hypothetical protein